MVAWVGREGGAQGQREAATVVARRVAQHRAGAAGGRRPRTGGSPEELVAGLVAVLLGVRPLVARPHRAHVLRIDHAGRPRPPPQGPRAP